MTAAARRAMNESWFRVLNERLESRAAERGDDETFEIVCECAREDCTARIQISLGAYEAVRAEPTAFVVVEGHADPAIERVVEAGTGYEIVEKLGEAAAVATIQNPRDGEGPGHAEGGG